MHFFLKVILRRVLLNKVARVCIEFKMYTVLSRIKTHDLTYHCELAFITFTAGIEIVTVKPFDLCLTFKLIFYS